MKNVNEYYEETNKYNKPSGLLKRFFNFIPNNTFKEKIAIDLGAGVRK